MAGRYRYTKTEHRLKRNMAKSFFTYPGYYNREYGGVDEDIDGISISGSRLLYFTERACKILRDDGTIVWIPKSKCIISPNYDTLYIFGSAVRKFGLFPVEKKKDFKPVYVLRKKKVE